MKRILLCLVLVLSAMCSNAYTRQDSLRGSNGRGRAWWDVLKYELDVRIDSSSQTLRGKCSITFRVVKAPNDSMQIDLQEGMTLDFYSGFPEMGSFSYRRDGNVFWVTGNRSLKVGEVVTTTFRFEGKPRIAVRAPWDGGLIWARDSLNNSWVAVACQGLGASSWWPCKDYQGDEPDSGVTTRITLHGAANRLTVIGNGRSKASIDTMQIEDPITGEIYTTLSPSAQSVVRNPINTYNTTFYIGDYAHWHDTLNGEKGVLDMDFYPLRFNEAKARKQWIQTKDMLRCFEYWLGPYPFYEDGYKLVEAPYLGMEHQGAIAYGNGYKNGYKAPWGHIDRSGTGVGFAFDYIIIHESGHEWFGNSITAQDIADNWLHEGFTTYTETLYAEWVRGRDKAFAYTMGQWQGIQNDRPVIGDYGVNDDGSGDKYDKGSAIVHMIRMMLNDDQQFRQLLRGLNRDFYHKIVTTKEVEDYISRFVGRDLKPFFDQYLRTTQKPVLSWKREKGVLRYEWKHAVPGFQAPFIAVSKKSRIVVADGQQAASGIYRADDSKAKWRVVPCGWYDVEEG